MIKKAIEIKRDIEADDSVLLDWFDMQKPNLCAITKEGIEFIIKAKYTHLHENDILLCEDGYKIKVSKSEDNIFILKFSDHITFARIAYEIGNRHQPICIEDFKITILEDIATSDIIKACEAIDSVTVEKAKAISLNQMEMLITATKMNYLALSRFIQLLDGIFPSGAFVHSFGLEPHVVLNLVNDKESLKNFLENIIEDQYQHMEFPLVKKLFRLLEQQNLGLIIKEDKKFASMLSFEYAKASKDLGENYLRHIDCDIKKQIVSEYYKNVKEAKAYGNELFILSSYAYELGLDEKYFLAIVVQKKLNKYSKCESKNFTNKT